MADQTALRGSCHCGRNQYIIHVPSNSSESAQILFDTRVTHRVSSATPLSAFIRVPLTWYHSRMFPFFPDETRSSIRRVYSDPIEQHAKRHFCGFCGTPLSYWSEQPRSEADYIQLTLGSLLTEDLHGLEEMGLIPGEPDQEDEMDTEPSPVSRSGNQLIGREFSTIPWFNDLLSGSRLGDMRTTRGVRQSEDGRTRIEFEITEWTGEDDSDGQDAETSESSNTGKRKRSDAGCKGATTRP
ncbi:hypothetical protein F5Y15DRAFT_40369 [Xylariaceae sp. FL0016]|nr:hypothetical protein F5Y15DRAFT_40369 [Xylariaceae sp. FL0016]